MLQLAVEVFAQVTVFVKECNEELTIHWEDDTTNSRHYGLLEEHAGRQE